MVDLSIGLLESGASGLRSFGYVYLAIAVLGTLHVILYKRDPRTSIAWISLIWLSPFLGVLFYLVFGINRIERKASRLTAYRDSPEFVSQETRDIREEAFSKYHELTHLVELGDRLAGPNLVYGNHIEELVSGDTIFQAMLRSIDGAKKSVTLMTYIFDRDEQGVEFVNALVAARKRGVAVRVLVDDIGANLLPFSITTLLKKHYIPYARFLPSYVPWLVQFLNLRNHRKLLVVDGEVAFTGGINISKRYRFSMKPKNPVRDIHFKVTGPVVNQLQAVFAYDWQFTTGETLEGRPWFTPNPQLTGKTFCRVLPDGPDFPRNRIRWIFLGALSMAKKSVRIMTPYFLPDSGLITAINTAVLRGVKVEIVLPGKSDHSFMHWAMMGSIWQVVETGCKVYLSPPPFEHSKLFIVDDLWVSCGSANWDVRSFRLNFEMNIDAFDDELCHRLTEYFNERKLNSALLELRTLNSRPLPERIRDGTARLFTPFL